MNPARSQKNFSWQTIWDLSKKFQLQEIQRSEEECTILKITIISSKMEWKLYICVQFWVFSDFCDYWYNHKGLCEISEKISWQTIWDLSKKFQLQEIQRSEEECTIVKITTISSKMEWKLYICVQFWVFSDFCDYWYNHKGLCEISEKFSWQTIWDLSEKFQLQEIYKSEDECTIIKMTIKSFKIA